MATVKIKGLKKITRKGRIYYYAWVGGPRLEAEYGTAEFLTEYAAAVAGRKASGDNLIHGLITAFKASPRWAGPHPKAYGEKTKESWVLWLDRIDAKFGKLMVSNFDKPALRPIVMDWRDSYAATPAAADKAMETLSVLLTYGMQRGKLMNNLCFGIDRLHESDRSGFIWTAADLDALQAAASLEVFQAAKLASLTGLRQADLMKLQLHHVKANSIEISTGKSRNRKTTLIPLYAELRTFLDTLPKRAITVLTNTDGRPWTGTSGFKSSWRTARERAAVKLAANGGDGDALRSLRFHDLRGTAATKLFVAGMSTREIAEMMTWREADVEALIDRYVRREDLLRDRIRRMDQGA